MIWCGVRQIFLGLPDLSVVDKPKNGGIKYAVRRLNELKNMLEDDKLKLTKVKNQYDFFYKSRKNDLNDRIVGLEKKLKAEGKKSTSSLDTELNDLKRDNQLKLANLKASGQAIHKINTAYLNKQKGLVEDYENFIKLFKE